MTGCGSCDKIIKNIEKKYYNKLKEKGIVLVGGVVNLDDEDEVKKIMEIRKNAKILIAVGSCAVGVSKECLLV